MPGSFMSENATGTTAYDQSTLPGGISAPSDATQALQKDAYTRPGQKTHEDSQVVPSDDKPHKDHEAGGFGTIVSGFINEVTHHPGHLLKVAAEGAAVAAGVAVGVALLPELAVVAAGAGAVGLAVGGFNLLKNAPKWSDEMAILDHADKFSAEQVEAARKDLHAVGGGTADVVASLAGGAVGGVGAVSAINAVRSAAIPSVVDAEFTVVDSGAPPPLRLPAPAQAAEGSSVPRLPAPEGGGPAPNAAPVESTVAQSPTGANVQAPEVPAAQVTAPEVTASPAATPEVPAQAVQNVQQVVAETPPVSNGQDMVRASNVTEQAAPGSPPQPERADLELIRTITERENGLRPRGLDRNYPLSMSELPPASTVVADSPSVSFVARPPAIGPEVSAQQLDRGAFLQSEGRTLIGEKGDILVTHNDGTQEILNQPEFEFRYTQRPVETAQPLMQYRNNQPVTAEESGYQTDERLRTIIKIEGDTTTMRGGLRDKLYERAPEYGPDVYRSRVPVSAQVLDRDTSFHRFDSQQSGVPGDYLITEGDGYQRIVPKAEFETWHERIEPEVQASRLAAPPSVAPVSETVTSQNAAISEPVQGQLFDSLSQKEVPVATAMAEKPSVPFQAVNLTAHTESPLQVQRIDSPVVMRTASGNIVSGGDGDLLVTSADGTQNIIGKDFFRGQYRPVPVEVSNPVLEYRKTAPIQAEIAREPFTWVNSHGETMYANANDYRVIQPNGKISSVTPDIFAGTYEAAPHLGPNSFLKTAITRAQLVDRDIRVPTFEGPGSGRSGDFLVTGPEGDQYVIPGSEFPGLYSRI